MTASDISSAMADEARRRYEAAVASSPQQRPKVSVSAGAASRAAALLQCWLPRCRAVSSEQMHQAACLRWIGKLCRI